MYFFLKIELIICNSIVLDNNSNIKELFLKYGEIDKPFEIQYQIILIN